MGRLVRGETEIEGGGEMITKERLDELCQRALMPTRDMIGLSHQELLNLVYVARLGLQFEEMKARAEKAEPLAKWARLEAAPTLRAYEHSDDDDFEAFVAAALVSLAALPKEAE